MAGKRGNSEGTIRKRGDGRWEARLVLRTGERKSLYGKTRQEAARLLAKALREREDGLSVLGDRQTVEEYLTTWIQTEKYRVKRSSSRRYGYEVRLRLIPRLGKIVLSKLTAQQIGTFYARELENGTTPNTVRYCHMVLHAALEDALKQGLVHRNVADMVDPPRRPKRKMAVYTEGQVHVLLRAVAGDRLEALCVLVLATGMREGELLALTWDEVDLERAIVTVRTTLHRYPGEGLVSEEAKTDHSNRVIALPRTVVGSLRHHKFKLAEEQARLGDAWTEQNLVFPNAIGQPIEPSGFRKRWWPRLVKKSGLPYIRFHDLRHTAATLLLARGIPVKVVSEMLGHAGVSITLDLYGHVLPHMQQQAAATMDEILQGRSPLA